MNKTNIHEVAKKFNYFTAENLTGDFLAYYNERLKDNKYKHENSLFPDFFNNCSEFETGFFWECRIQDEGTEKEYKYIEQSERLLMKKGTDIILMLKKDWKAKDKFYLHPLYNYVNKLTSNLSSYERNEATKKLIQPNLIGVFTVSKLNAWADYCFILLDTYTAVKNKIEGKNSEALKTVNDFINSLGGKCEIRKDSKNLNFWIDTNLFSVSFIIHSDSGYLEQKISYKGGLNNISKITNLIG
jgi:hypothetical protein